MEVVWHCRRLAPPSLCPLLSELRLSHHPRHLGELPPPHRQWVCSLQSSVLDEHQEGGWLECAHPGRQRLELLSWPLTLLLHHGEAPLAQMTVVPSLTLRALQSLGLPYFPCPSGGAQRKPSPGMEFVKVPSDTASCLPSLPSPPAISSWADHVGAHCPSGVVTCPLCAEGSHPLGVMSTSLAAN